MLIILLIYFKTLNYSYNLDDKFATSIHPSVKKGVKGIPEILTSPYMGKNEPRYGGYRPITRVTFAIEYSLFGEKPNISHFLNILIYVFCCIFFFHLVKYLFAEWDWPFWYAAVFIFMLHPLHVEVVSSLKNREVLLSFLFGISSILILVRYKNIQYLLLSIALFTLAVFSKLDAVFFPVFAAFIFYFLGRWSLKKSLIYGLSLPAVAVACYLLVQTTFPEPLNLGVHTYENPIVGHEFTANHFATVSYLLAYMIRLVFIPNQFIYFYGTGFFNLMNWGNWIVIVSAIFHLALLVLMIKGFFKRKKYTLIIFYYFFSIGLYMNLIQMMPGVIGDRLMFIAVGAAAMIVPYLLNVFYKKSNNNKLVKYVGLGIIFGACLYMSAQAYNRVDCWENTVTLGECDIDQLSESYLSQIIYLGFLESEIKRGNSKYNKNELIKKSIAHAGIALKHYPKSADAKKHLGYIFCAELDSIRLGGQLLYEALQEEPTNPHVLYNLGICFDKKGEAANALKFYKEANKYQEKSVEIKSKLVMAYCASGNIQSARKEVDNLMKNYAYDYKSFISEGTYYLYLKDTLKATQSFEKALAIKPDLVSLKNQIRDYYKSKGNVEKVEFYSR